MSLFSLITDTDARSAMSQENDSRHIVTHTVIIFHHCDMERGRPQVTMTKLWQMMQSRNTKKLNLDKDLDEILNRIKQARIDQDKEVLGTRRGRRLIVVTVMKGVCMHTSILGPYVEKLSDDWQIYLEEKDESLAFASNKTAKITATKSSAKTCGNRMRFCITAGRIMWQVRMLLASLRNLSDFRECLEVLVKILEQRIW